MRSHFTLARFATFPAVLAVALGTMAGSARAQSQTDLVDPTAWWWQTNVTLQDINDRIAQGYRIVDIEVEDDSPLRFSAAFVHNSGAYAKSWWWYYGQTEADVNSRFGQHNARLIDVEPYQTSSGLRFAIVLISNTGQDFASTHGWHYGWTFNQVANWVANPAGRRIIDIQPYIDGGSQRYAFTYVNNSGALASGWWVYLNSSAATITNALANNNARLIDLEPHDGSGTFSCVMVPNDGNAWFWFYNLQYGDIDFLANEYASRIIDLQRYTTSSGPTRYAMVLRRNDNDLAVETAINMRSYLPFSASSGFLLREFNGATSTMAGVYENEIFEPASLMKTAHHFTAFREIALGNDALGSPVVENTGLNGSCPTGSGPVVRTLSAVLRDMMESSSNTATEAIRARYGTVFIETVAGIFGATNVALNHTLGCLCGSPRNEITLMDLADLHEAVIGGVMGNFRDEFYEHMSNGTGFGMGSFGTTAVLDDELAASTLSATQQQSFRSQMLLAHKGGSYTCTSGSNSEEHRSRGAYVRLPHKLGCEVVMQEYFIGAWVNDANTATQAQEAVGIALTTLYRDRVREAIDTWETATCDPFNTYCSANSNSLGVPGTISGTGSSYVVANDLNVGAGNISPSSFGYLLVSPTQAFVSMPGGSAGNLCLGGNIGRYSSMVMNSGTSGTYSMQVDLTAIPLPSGLTYSVSPGDELNFQWWYRDISPTGAPTSNFTNGLNVRFQ